MIYVISGMSGSGKTTIAKCVSEILNIPIIINSTTRPMRPNEVNGVDYHFISDDNFANSKMAVEEHFVVANGDTWSYGIREKDLQNDCVIVSSPKTIEQLKEKYDIIDIYMYVNRNTRLNRIHDRNDNQSQKEIIRREREDSEIFKSYKPKYKINNNGSISRSINDIKHLLLTINK